MFLSVAWFGLGLQGLCIGGASWEIGSLMRLRRPRDPPAEQVQRQSPVFMGAQCSWRGEGGSDLQGAHEKQTNGPR